MAENIHTFLSRTWYLSSPAMAIVFSPATNELTSSLEGVTVTPREIETSRRRPGDVA